MRTNAPTGPKGEEGENRKAEDRESAQKRLFEGYKKHGIPNVPRTEHDYTKTSALDEAYQAGVFQALSDAGLIKPN